MGLLSRLLGRTAKSAFSHDEWRRAFGSVVDMSPAAQAARADEFFPTTAFRGLREKPRDPKNWQWFSDNPDIASTYALNPEPNVMPARLNMHNALEIDADGAVYNEIKLKNLPQNVRERINSQEDRYGTSTDRIAGIANALGYDGVVFRNVRDALMSNTKTTPPSTVYLSFKPERVRSRFATFDPDRLDVAELAAGIGGLGVGGGLLSAAQRGRQA